MTMLRALKPFIPAGKDFAKAKQFFLDLGFVKRWESDGYAGMELGGVSFILQDFEHPQMQENLMMLVEVEDLDAFWKHLTDSGVAQRYAGVRVAEPTVYPWGQREVHLIDPAGVCWHFV